MESSVVHSFELEIVARNKTETTRDEKKNHPVEIGWRWTETVWRIEANAFNFKRENFSDLAIVSTLGFFVFRPTASCL